MQSTPSLLRLASHAPRTYAGSPRTSMPMYAASSGSSLLPSWNETPNFVASCTFSLTPPCRAWPEHFRHYTSANQTAEDKSISWETHLADEDLVGVGPVAVGGVEEGDAGVDGVVDERDHVGLGLRRAVPRPRADTSNPCEPGFMRGTTNGAAAMAIARGYVTGCSKRERPNYQLTGGSKWRLDTRRPGFRTTYSEARNHSTMSPQVIDRRCTVDATKKAYPCQRIEEHKSAAQD
ncbi:hypothetical protein EJB05_37112, partial [Eragrostis curvula]